MADSQRQLFMNAVVSALNTVSSLVVSETLVGWEEAQPKGLQSIFAFPIDHDESREAFSLYGGPVGADEKATLKLTVTCYAYRQDNDGAKLRKLRTDLIRDIYAAMEGAVSSGALAVLDLRMPNVVTDHGVLERYSIFDLELELDYLFRHSIGG
jgi:hypothetical protein